MIALKNNGFGVEQYVDTCVYFCNLFVLNYSTNTSFILCHLRMSSNKSFKVHTAGTIVKNKHWWIVHVEIYLRMAMKIIIVLLKHSNITYTGFML